MDLANTLVWLQTAWLALVLRYGFCIDQKEEFRPSIFGALLWIAIIGLNIYLFTLKGAVF